MAIPHAGGGGSDGGANLAGDQATLQVAVHSIWRYLRMHGASATEAEDLTQDAFVIALQKGALSAAPAAQQAFLQRTARFLFLRARRASAHAEAVADAVDELWRADCENDGGEGRVAAARECIEQLGERARRAVEMAYGVKQHAQSRAAMALALGMQENGVKTLMQRTRTLLRDCIERKVQR